MRCFCSIKISNASNGMSEKEMYVVRRAHDHSATIKKSSYPVHCHQMCAFSTKIRMKKEIWKISNVPRVWVLSTYMHKNMNRWYSSNIMKAAEDSMVTHLYWRKCELKTKTKVKVEKAYECLTTVFGSHFASTHMRNYITAKRARTAYTLIRV